MAAYSAAEPQGIGTFRSLHSLGNRTNKLSRSTHSFENRIFVGSDVLLDVILERYPHFEYSQQIIALVEKCVFKGFTSSIILANCFYIIVNKFTYTRAAGAIQKVRSIFEILPFSDKEIGESPSSNIADFEDGIQYYIAFNYRYNNHQKYKRL